MHTDDITDRIKRAIEKAHLSMSKVIFRSVSAEDAVLQWQWQEKQ